MASVRLKKQDKIDIMEAVLTSASKERMEHLMNRENQVARACYLDAIKGYGKHIQAVPAGYYSDRDEIQVHLHKNVQDLKGERNAITYKRCRLTTDRDDFPESSLGFHYSADAFEIGSTVRMPQNMAYGKLRLLVSSPLGQEVKELMTAQEKLHEDLKNLGDTVRKALLECTTVKKLIDNYPELKPYAPADIANTRIAVAHGKIESLIKCTKAETCDEEPKTKAKKPDVINL